jgi:hemerythrin HHE cation binding domain-containing protein
LTSDLDERSGWPPELRVLLERHPRVSWQQHGSASVALWLDVHDGFRHECSALDAAGADYRDRRMTAAQLAAVTAPRLRGLIGRLRGHHEIEDYHYFPVLRDTDPRLELGFDALAADHESLHGDIAATAAALTELLSATDPKSLRDTAAPRHAAERFVAASGRLNRRLGQHLRDEEDLVIPLLLDRDG